MNDDDSGAISGENNGNTQLVNLLARKEKLVGSSILITGLFVVNNECFDSD